MRAYATKQTFHQGWRHFRVKQIKTNKIKNYHLPLIFNNKRGLQKRDVRGAGVKIQGFY